MKSPMRLRALPALMVLMLALVACGNGGDSAQAESSEAVATGAQSAATSAPVSSDAPAQDAMHPTRIAQGEEVDLTDHLAKGEITVFDFMSDFCPPCRQIAPWLDRVHNEREGVKVVKVDINRPDVQGRIDWRSPVAAQYGLRSIPAFRIYAADGSLMAEGDAAREMLFAWFGELPEVQG